MKSRIFFDLKKEKINLIIYQNQNFIEIISIILREIF